MNNESSSFKCGNLYWSCVNESQSSLHNIAHVDQKIQDDTLKFLNSMCSYTRITDNDNDDDDKSSGDGGGSGSDNDYVYILW